MCVTYISFVFLKHSLLFFVHHEQEHNWFKTRLSVACCVTKTSVTKIILRAQSRNRYPVLFPWPRFLDWVFEFWHGRLCYQVLSDSVTASFWSWQRCWKWGSRSWDVEMVRGHRQTSIITALRMRWLLFLSLENMWKYPHDAPCTNAFHHLHTTTSIQSFTDTFCMAPMIDKGHS